LPRAVVYLVPAMTAADSVDLRSVWGDPALSALDGEAGVSSGLRAAVSGLAGSAVSLLLSTLAERHPTQWLVVAAGLAEAEAIVGDLETLGAAEVHYLPELEILPFDRRSPTREILAEIQAGLQALDEGRSGFFVTTLYGLRHRVMAREVLRRHRLVLRKGQRVDTDWLQEKLATLGYHPAGLVELPGDMALRGGIIDVYSPAHELPLRLEFFGDELESIRGFEPIDQRSREEREEALILPAGPVVMDDDTLLTAMARVESMKEFSEDDRTHLIERLQDRLHFQGLEGLAPFFHEQANLLSYLREDAVVALVSPDELVRRNEELDVETRRVRDDRLRRGDPVPLPEELMTPLDELDRLSAGHGRLWLGEMVLPGAGEAPLAPPAELHPIQVETRAQARGRGDVEAFLRDATTWREEGMEVHLFCANAGQRDRLAELFDEADPHSVHPHLRIGVLHGGFLWPGASLACLTDHELFDRYRRPQRRRRSFGGRKVGDPKALRPGDFVVHSDHGIGRFLGLRKITAEGVENEYLLLEYAGGDRLYLPTEKLQLVERYEVADSGEPELHKLGGHQWERTRNRARKAIRAMAQELLSLYAARASLPGHAFAEDTHLQREMEASFLHEETPDQLTAVQDVKRDMESPRPMDRLICGDVGFGKTEVAIRAAFKAVMDHRQVAVLCPTTILAEQHGETFSQRLREYPITVEVLSRFKSAKEQREILRRLKAGEVDILVGTHRLLGRDVEFARLGLLVVDEEQRFGVRHKERLKEMRKQVDVLAMSATPIPRTLYLSLMGARDMSIIATPPRDRLPIHTEVIPYSEDVIAEAILREMHRGGQVFFVHNRVETIDTMAKIVTRIVPSARVAVAHGQMKESQLESIMRDFVHQKYDVLVTTMIIESGLDMPNVNTILIDRADRLGLSQLYQLRGRVGRSRHRAYAHLMTPPGQAIAPDARRRLRAIQEFTDLGSGYHIAMRDLEIRGAGNILGEAQHGHIATIGFDLYCKLLEEEIRDLKGEGLPRLHDIKVDLRVASYLPDEYLSEPEEKIRWYRELGRVGSEEELDRLAEELRDRFGPLPPVARNLVDITRIKLRALVCGIEDIRWSRKGVRMIFTGDRQPDATILQGLAGTGLPRLAFNAVDRLVMTIEVPREEWITACLVVLGRLADARRRAGSTTE